LAGLPNWFLTLCRMLHEQVEHILVIGHSRSGGIRALMSMPDEETISRLAIISLREREYNFIKMLTRTTSHPLPSELDLLGVLQV